MSDEGTNPPEAGVTDTESAVRWLTDPEKGAPESGETEAAQEPQEPEQEATEGEAPEAEEDDGAAADTDAEDGEEETSEEDPRYTVKVDGEEYEVNLSELVSGYQKGADYQRKTAAVAEERRTLQAEKQQIEQMRGQLAQEYERVAALGKEDEPDWEKLAEDPWEFTRQKAAWEKKERQRQDAAQKAQEMQQQQHMQTVLDHGRKLLEKVPEWKNPGRFEKERAELLQAARQYGFSDQEFMGAVDHRAFLMLRDAMAYRKMAEAQEKAPAAKKVPKKAQKSLQPGAKSTPSENRARDTDRARDRLRKSGSVDDAVRYLLGK